MASLVARRMHLGITTWAIEQETGLNRHTVDRVLGDSSQLEALPLRIATRLAHILGLSTADQLTAPNTTLHTAEDATEHIDAPRIAAALHAWGGWVEPDEIAQVLDLDAERTETALDYLASLLADTGMTVLTSPHLGVKLAANPDHLNEADLDDIARLRIRSREPSYATACVISEAMLTGEIWRYADDTTFDILRRLGYIRRGHSRFGVHPDIEYSIAEADAETRPRPRSRRGRGGAATTDNPRPDAQDEQ